MGIDKQKPRGTFKHKDMGHMNKDDDDAPNNPPNRGTF
jgi:hypothetical protein